MLKRTAFFAWVLLAGLVAGLPALAGAAAAAFPFPQNRQQPTTSYYPVYNNADVQTAYNFFLSEQVTSAGAGGFRRVRRHGDPTLQPDSTVSEGIGYGMIIAVYMNDQALFDDLWRYYNLHLDGNGLMHWYISADGNTILGSGAASDADQDVAWALCMAIYQWGTPTFGGTYQALAQGLITKIYNVFVDPTTKALWPWGGAGNTFNVSYFDPAMYRAFAQVSGNPGWLDVVDGCYDLLFASLKAANGNQTNGLVPAWSNAAGDAVPGFAGAPIHFQYDSCRTPGRIGKDWYFFGEPRAKQYLDLINSFYVPIGADNITDGYNLNGTERPQYDTLGGGDTGQSAAFVAPAMMGASCDAANAAFVQTAYDNLKTNTLLIGGPYYDQSWTVMGLLWASGNYLNYMPTPTPTPTPDACQFKIKLNAAGGAQSGFVADKAYGAGSYGYVAGYTGAVGTSGGPVTGTSNPGLYLSERYGGEVRYTFTVPNGPATVTLHWAETYENAAGARQIDVYVGATLVENNLDIFAAAGGKNKALVRNYNTTVTGGTVTLRFVAAVGANATIHAIEVTAGNLCTPTVSPTRTPFYSTTPTPSRTPSFSPSPSFSVSPTRTPSPTVSATFTALPTPDACTLVRRVNCAGGAFTDTAGSAWAADKAYTAGTWGYDAAGVGAAGTSGGPIAGTPDDTLYMSERYGNPVAYRFDVPNGSYFVRVKLAETYMDTANNRQLTLQANGATRLNADLFTWAGGKNVARDLTFTVTVSTGRIDLVASSSNNSGTLMAIEVLGLAGCTPTRTPSFTPGAASPTATRTASPSATATLSASPSATRSATPTRTLTATPSPTPTSSSTLTLTYSLTATVSPTATLSHSPVPGTATYSPTLSASPTSTPTPSGSPTSTGTLSSTSTRSATPSATLTSTRSATTTLTSTLSATPSATASVSSTPSISPTFTPVPVGSTDTPTPSVTSSFSPSSTVTLSRTGTPSATVTRSSTGTPSPTFTLTGSSTRTHTSTVTRTPPSPMFTPSPTATPTRSATRTATSTVVVPLPTATATPTEVGPSVSSTLTPAPAGEAPEIEDFAVMPSPWNGQGPVKLYLKLKGPADAIHWKLYTPAMVCVAQGQSGYRSAAWSQGDLSNAWQGLNSGLYYLVLSSEGGGRQKEAARKGRIYVSR